MTKLKQAGLFALLIWPTLLWAEMETIDVTIDYVGPTEGQVWDGVQQGLNEANLQGQFLGQKYTINVMSQDELADVSADDITALLVSTDADNTLAIAKMKNLANVPVFNLTSDADSLRQSCQPNLLNILPSQKMKADAVAQWQQKNPDTAVTPRAWHEDFEKFAASQLNNRFEKTHDKKMGDDAYGGWAAVKMLSDTVARTQNTGAADMLNFLKNDLSFDGQKGDTGTFRDTGQLRQIVLLIDEDNTIVAEAPLRGVKGGLESLGLTTCKK
jgi:hypothetical protein